MRRAQRWLQTNADRVSETIVRETGKTFEDAALGEIGYGVAAFGFWAKHGPRYLATRRVHSKAIAGFGPASITERRHGVVLGNAEGRETDARAARCETDRKRPVQASC
jgi:acyl-CoA reductase-like NAD-dependent aldehyde dehydrogenase